MEAEHIARTLHPLERKVLALLDRAQDFDELVKQSKLKQVEVMRALQWMRNKKIVNLQEKKTEIVKLGKNGKSYVEKGLPERILLKHLKDKEAGVSELSSIGLSKEELSVAIGVLKKKAALDFEKNKIRLNSNGKRLLDKDMMEEAFLKTLSHNRVLDELKHEERFALENLKKRKGILEITEHKTIKAVMTQLGKDVKKGLRHEDQIGSLTPKVMKNQGWKKKKFRAYDVRADVPKISPGKIHPYKSFLDQVRKKFLELGFKERTGPIVETDFWNMDALFMPQFHSARDIHSAYYIKEPKHAKSLPKAVVNRVRKAHENGYTTNSKGWGYKFDVKRTKRLLLRTQDTAISPKTLCSPDLEIPGKYFHIVRCFRYDVIDATHLPDFYQTGGFVVEQGLNLRHLVGLLTLFAKEFADTDKIKIIPSYFPFTEPSAALLAKHPNMGWVELAGSGIFRPEMTWPLGVKAPVIAWGLGVDRLAMFKLGIRDIRQLFSRNLDFLREVKIV
jgi:phenylalanyl-tRNA synthetase alpha chain